jgi:hypothetical protein
LRLVRYTREDLEAGRMDWMAMTPTEYAALDSRELALLSQLTAKTRYFSG